MAIESRTIENETDELRDQLSDLTQDERKAIFSACWRMARIDGRVSTCEMTELNRLHRVLFDAEMPKTAYPYREHERFDEYLLRPLAQRAFFDTLFELLQADGQITGIEQELFFEMAKSLGFEKEAAEKAWWQSACEAFRRGCRSRIKKNFDSLTSELQLLAERLDLPDDEAGNVAKAELQNAIKHVAFPGRP
jgi:uncharacterized tellurite resistance protein B-like protein